MSLVLACLAACAGLAPQSPTAEGLPERALTLYQQGFGVVREQLDLTLVAGDNPLNFSGATAQVEPDSVILRPLGAGPAFRIREQGYRNDPVSQGLLLAFFEGQSIDFRVEHATGTELVRGRILRSGYKDGSSSPLIEVDGRLRFSLPGEPLFPALPDDALLRPTLNWVLESSASGRVAAELSYLSGGFDWSADYNAITTDQGDGLQLLGWVTLRNDSGKHFEETEVKLIAGDVHRLQSGALFAAGRGGLEKLGYAGPVEERSFDEYHLYSLPNRLDLRDQESKQVEFVRAPAVPAKRFYVYDGAELSAWLGWDPIARRTQPELGAQANDKVRVVREFMNKKEGGLGVPLPAGRVRFYQADIDGRLEFIGENQIDHTPKDERVRLETGTAFDLKGERVRTNISIDEGRRTASETFQVELRNHKDAAVEILVVEHLYRWTNWKIENSTQAFDKRDAETIEFKLQVPANGSTKLGYQVNYSW